jgi:hypothetical protein
MCKPPWSEDEVERLNEYQRCGWVHPFTCPNRDDGKHRDEGVLVAAVEGWYCPDCDYTQNWCHEFMLRGAPPNPFEIFGYDEYE